MIPFDLSHLRQVARLREALEKYGVHILGCDKIHQEPLPCTCGLDLALSQGEAGGET